MFQNDLEKMKLSEVERQKLEKLSSWQWMNITQL